MCSILHRVAASRVYNGQIDVFYSKGRNWCQSELCKFEIRPLQFTGASTIQVTGGFSHAIKDRHVNP